MATVELYHYVFELFIQYWEVEKVGSLRRPEKTVSKAELDERAAMADGLKDFIFHFKSVVGDHGKGKRMSLYYSALGTHAQPSMANAGLEGHNGGLKVRKLHKCLWRI